MPNKLKNNIRGDKKIKINERSTTKEIKKLTRKVLKELETKKIEELERNLYFVVIKNRFCGRPNSIEEELKVRKITRKKKKDKLKTEIKDMKKLKIEMVEYKSSKLLDDLNMEKAFEIDRIKEIEINLRN